MRTAAIEYTHDELRLVGELAVDDSFSVPRPGDRAGWTGPPARAGFRGPRPGRRDRLLLRWHARLGTRPRRADLKAVIGFHSGHPRTTYHPVHGDMAGRPLSATV